MIPDGAIRTKEYREIVSNLPSILSGRKKAMATEILLPSLKCPEVFQCVPLTDDERSELRKDGVMKWGEAHGDPLAYIMSTLWTVELSLVDPKMRKRDLYEFMRVLVGSVSAWRAKEIRKAIVTKTENLSKLHPGLLGES